MAASAAPAAAPAAAKSSAPVSTPGAPSAAVTALNAQRAANVAAGVSAYAGTAASLSSFTSANPTLSSAGGTGGGPEAGFNADNTIQAPTGGGGTVIAPGVTNKGPTTTPSAPAIVTSNQSRTQFANNASTLNSALTRAGSGNGVSIVDYLNSSGMPSDFASRSALAEQNGITGYVGSAAQNLQLLNTLQNGPPKNGTNQPVTPTNSTAPATDTTTTPATSTTTPTPAGTTNPDGSTTNADGTTTNADGSTTDPNDPTSGLPPAIAAEYKGILAQQDDAITTAQNNLTQARATLTDDPAALAAADAISASYGTLITAMQAKNTQVIAKAQAGEAAFGGLGVMPQTFMSDEMDAASGRIATLVGEEQAALLKSNTAYENDDVKAFNDAQTALNTATNDKKTTLGDLLTATNNQVKAVQAQQKIDAANTKAGLASDVTTSAKIAASTAQALSEAGITDPAEIASYLSEVAQQNGISNVNILQSAVVTAQAANTKANLSNENVSSEIQKRGGSGGGSSTTKVKGGTDGTYAYTPSDLNSYSTLLTQGGTINGTKFDGTGSDGYVDPGAYTTVFNDWIKNGGTSAGFLKKYPVKSVNPASYAQLPAAIRPKSAATASSGYTT